MANTLARFIATLDELDPNSDSYDVEHVKRLGATERQAAEDALLERVRLRDDPRAMVTLGRLGVGRAASTLTQKAQHPNAWVRFSAHRALAALGVAEGTHGLAVDASRGSSVERFGAVMELATVAGDEAFAVLLLGLDDADALVRGRAMQSLIERFGLTGLTRDAVGKVLLESPLKTLETLVMCEVRPIHQMAGWQAALLFRRVEAGEDPKAAGLEYVRTQADGFRSRVADSFFDDEAPFDVGLVAAASGHDRAWAEAFLALQLEPDARSVRAVDAIAALGATWLVPGLKASAEGLADGHVYKVAVDQAVSVLGG
jgi:hypothetical protein